MFAFLSMGGSQDTTSSVSEMGLVDTLWGAPGTVAGVIVE